MSEEPTTAEKVPFRRPIWLRLWRMLRLFQRSESGLRATFLFIALLTLMLAINGLNVVNSYVGRDFMTAIENRAMAEFASQALLYIGGVRALDLGGGVLPVCGGAPGPAVARWLTGGRCGTTWITGRITGSGMPASCRIRTNGSRTTSGR